MKKRRDQNGHRSSRLPPVFEGGYGWPEKRGLYDPAFEHESCGVGFVAHVKGHRSHQIVQDADCVLQNMDHRGARGSEPNTGDGAGMLTALPHDFLRKVARSDLKKELPEPGKFAAGIVFLPRVESERKFCRHLVGRIIVENEQRLIGWRKVPVDADAADIGPSARESEPCVEQLFIAAQEGIDQEEFERKLYLIRKEASHKLRGGQLEQAKMFYINSLSTKVIVYKGMLTAGQVTTYYRDLADPDYTTHLAMVHSRFSTNTFPSWDRAQPMRFMSHNGEINTLRGNVNWMHAREDFLHSDLFGKDLEKIFPVIEADSSDSGNFDNALEFLLMTGRTLQEAVMMMIPEAWQHHRSMSPELKAFYEYHACLQEPWDGPASITFTDGHYIGAVLDRNGLRPSRFYLTHDDRVVMASEAGVLPSIAPEMVKEKGRLKPGRLFLIDFEQGRMVPDSELKREFAAKRPYREWLDAQQLALEDIEPAGEPEGYEASTLIPRLAAHGYNIETLHHILIPMLEQGKDPIGSMGNDAALACMSSQPRNIYDYFRQLFAQVTNPAIDSIREEIIMSLECYVGPEGDLLQYKEENAHLLRIKHPILTNTELAALKHIKNSPSGRGWRSKVVDMTWPREQGVDGLKRALRRISRDTDEAIDNGYELVILSDRTTSADRVPVGTLLACASLHHHLVRQARRTQIGIILESGDARAVHHHCTLIGYGADAINPYLAYEILWKARRDGKLDKTRFPDDAAVAAGYRKSVAKGILKVMGKMGISTLQSYKGAQIFEAIGLADHVVDHCFTGTPSRIRGIGFSILAKEALQRHAAGYPPNGQDLPSVLENPGRYHWRADGERHMWDPESIADLQIASRSNDASAYERFSRHVNEHVTPRCALRGLVKFNYNINEAIPLDAVEPASEIVKRFCTGAMSFGSLSPEAHETLAVAMNRIGAKSNSGEGGEDEERYFTLPNGDSKRSAIKQVASGRFGVSGWYLTNADELQIKVAQGAKPGEGGELPGYKVDATIARIRCSTPGVGLISPPPHHDIYSIEDLKQLIHDLKNANPEARISVKLVSEVGVGTIAAGVAKAHADHILISGAEGGTGASPLTSIKHAGLPWELGISETHQILVMNDLRSRVVLQTDGQMKTGRDVAIAALLGAEEFGLGTAPLISLGCIMMRKCHLNTCPVGVATQDPDLRKKFTGIPENVINYLFMVAEELRAIMADLGFRSVEEMVGRVDCLESDHDAAEGKARTLDLSLMLTPALSMRDDEQGCVKVPQDHGLDGALDNKLIAEAQRAIRYGHKVSIDSPVLNTNRVVGAMLSHEVVKQHAAKGLPDDTIRIRLTGSAGQSLGAFLAPGITLELEGDANDYVGKGLSGGRIIIYPSKSATFAPMDNVIVGNVVLYGATSGTAFFRGYAAERFCVRNSGATAVIEGAGDHACEYMTGGRVIILGPTGRNFAAGMSGGIAYVLADRTHFANHCCNAELVDLDSLTDPREISKVRGLIEDHQRFTGSEVARRVLENWNESVKQLIRVIPREYKRILAAKKHDVVSEQVPSGT